MPTNVNIQRLAQQRTRVTEVHWPRIPRPPDSLMKFPGMEAWWKQVELMQERQQEMIYRMTLTKEEG